MTNRQNQETLRLPLPFMGMQATFSEQTCHVPEAVHRESPSTSGPTRRRGATLRAPPMNLAERATLRTGPLPEGALDAAGAAMASTVTIDRAAARNSASPRVSASSCRPG